MAFQDELDELMAEMGRMDVNCTEHGAAVASGGDDTTPEPDPSAIHSAEPGGPHVNRNAGEGLHVKDE